MLAFALVSLASAALAEPIKRQLIPAPSVTIKNGTVVGASDLLNGVDTFYGIPFADPPVGTNRLRNPSAVTKPWATITATGTPTACPQYAISMPTPTGLSATVQGLLENNPVYQTVTNIGEDCLTINIQRPKGLQSGVKIPVVAYIYGGGFEAGSASMYNDLTLIKHSMSIGHPIVYVTMGYRIGAYGFLAGKQVSDEGVANLGLKDQRLALEWIQENIAAFGGDPGQVTIWGESAGAISVYDQTIVNGGNNLYNGKPLFVGGIMNSGSVVPARQVSSSKAQAVYDEVVRNSACAGVDPSQSLECLRKLDFYDFNLAATTPPGIFDYQSLALSYLPRPDSPDAFFSQSPEEALVQGKYSKTPVLIGDQEDEGTLFSLVTSNVSNTDELVTYLNSFLFEGIPRQYVQKLVDAYPDDPSAGSPFNTGILYNIYPEYKRLSAINGDITFTLTRRDYLANITNNGVPAWSFLNTYLQGTSLLGTFHASDVVVNRIVDIFPIVRAATLTYYTSFAYYQDPNRISGQVNWPKYNTSNPQLLQFQPLSLNTLADNFRPVQYNTLVSLTGILKV